jgi:hypothetical protein
MKTIINLITVFAIFAITACSKLDVVGNDSIRAFNDLLENAPQLMAEDETAWYIIAPDSPVGFIWSKNFAESPLYDVMLEFDATPFIAAGLDPSKLPDNFILLDDMFIAVGTKLGNEILSYKGEITPLASYEQIVKLKRSSIGYHMQMDHYGINLGNGNMFEWAKNLATNDKDIVFVLDPAPFIAAGTDPAKIEGWTFAKVTVDNENGKPVVVDKILKPYNLK